MPIPSHYDSLHSDRLAEWNVDGRRAVDMARFVRLAEWYVDGRQAVDMALSRLAEWYVMDELKLYILMAIGTTQQLMQQS